MVKECYRLEEGELKTESAEPTVSLATLGYRDLGKFTARSPFDLSIITNLQDPVYRNLHKANHETESHFVHSIVSGHCDSDL